MYMFVPKAVYLTVTVDPSFPNACRREPYYSLLLHFAEFQYVSIRIGPRFIGLAPDGTELEDDGG
jgi:hypothetical protein